MITVAQARPRIAKAFGLCASDTRVITIINRAIERLLPKGKWKGTTQRYRICTNSDCITWPRQIETIEAFAICGRPHNVRNEWFEFLESGQGILSSTACNGGQLVDRGEVCAFDDITAGTWGYIRIYSDLPESGKYIILQGCDDNGNWIRTLDSGEYIDGIKVAIPSATNSVPNQKFSRLVRVIKDATNGPVRLYEYDGVQNIRALAVYEPDELVPSYRRSYVPGLRNRSSGSACDKVSIEVMAKLRFYEVSKENDFLLIGCLPALEEMAKGLRMFDCEQWQQAYACEARAVGYLQSELASHQGDGPVLQLRVAQDVGAGMVENVL